MTPDWRDLLAISILLWRSGKQDLAERFDKWREELESFEKSNEMLNEADRDHMRFYDSTR